METKCEPMDIVLTSNPPQSRCKNCGQTWYCHKEPPVCKETKDIEKEGKCNCDREYGTVSKDCTICSTSDKTWEERWRTLFTDTVNPFTNEIIENFIQQELTSATIKAKEEERERILRFAIYNIREGKRWVEIPEHWILEEPKN